MTRSVWTMPGPVRRGGCGTLPDGAQLTWSLAEGTRGRRWRAARVRDGRLEGALLLEVDAGGRPARLELATADGLLTLHPEPGDQQLHGNVVANEGIRHLIFPWSAEHELVVDGFPVVLMAAVRRLTATIGAGQSVARSAVVVGVGLACRGGVVRLDRLDGNRWRATGEGSALEVAIDADGAPLGLRQAADWPLET